MSDSAMSIIKAKMEKLKALQSFDLEEKEGELSDAKAALRKEQKRVDDLVAEITDYKLTVGLPVEETSGGALTSEELTARIVDVMPRFHNGANGKEIADAIGIYGIGTDDISNLYWAKDQTTLKKTGKGMNTKYFLASEADLEAINKSKETEKAERAKAKS